MTKNINMVSLFTGAGGLDYGFEAAGFKVCAAVEFDADCCATLRANRKWPIVEDDIHKVGTGDILDTASLRPGEVDMLIGGPPCQPFSKSGYWTNGDTRRLHDPRADTLFAFMRCVAEMKPRAFLLENVHGISYSGKEEGFRLLIKLTEQINREEGTDYRLSWKVINAADYGVPQIRQRFFMVAERDGKTFEFPAPTHGPEDKLCVQQTLFERKVQPYVTAWDAIGSTRADPGEDLTVKGRWASLLPSIPEGENYLWHTERKGGLSLFGWRRRYWSFLLKLAKNRPSWTIQAQPGPAIGPFHWKNRRLSVAEMAGLQTFPKDTVFIGSRVSVQKQIGNAVPSLLGEVLARAIAEQFFGLRRRKLLEHAVSLNRPIPPAEPIRSVPQKFTHLVGKHSAHPGTGKGNSGRANVSALR